jgi:penicillin-binding protein 1A
VKRKTIFFITLIFLALSVGIITGFGLFYFGDLPKIRALEEYHPYEASRVYSKDGELIAEFYIERRIVIPFSEVPKYVKDAILAVEDVRFFSHPGLDIQGVLRALWADIKAREIVQGGSTITQQLSKMLFLKPEKSIIRKIKEAIIALQIERTYSKNEILNLYLNQVYFGSGAYGIEAAAQRYFGKRAKDLTLSESAMLSGLPKAPASFSPFKNPERAKLRRSHVLRRMVETGFITEEEAEKAEKEPMPTPPKEGFNKAPYFIEFIRQELEGRYGHEVYTGGLNIYTTLDLKAQDVAEKALHKWLKAIDRRYKWRDIPVQGALLAIDPGTGYIKAMVGGRDFYESQFNRAYQALRQPGSAFKPFVFMTAIDNGFTPDNIIMDSPVSYPGSKKGIRWSPNNFSGKFQGPVTLRKALAESINVVAVKLLDMIGVNTTIEYAKKLGIKSDLKPYLPLALGASDLTLIEITSAYGVFANEGIKSTPMAILKVTDRMGRVLEENLPSPEEVIKPETAYLMTDLLKGVIEHGTGWKAKSLGRPLAGKTGTTNEYNDAWFIGYSPSLVAGVWVGYDDHRSIGPKETGARAALPIWIDFMKDFLKDTSPEDFPVPEGIMIITEDGKKKAILRSSLNHESDKKSEPTTHPAEIKDIPRKVDEAPE